jgi:hypothetical protein
MLRVFVAVIAFIAVIHFSFSQKRRVFTLENDSDFDKVALYLSATSNTCYIRPVNNSKILSVFSHSADTADQPTINSIVEDRINRVHILYNRPDDYFMSSMTQKLFNRSPEHNNNWDYYLSNQKPLLLNLDYAIGNAEVDLSNLPVERLRIRTGNADVKVEYQEDRCNLVEMDTFFVRVDMGSLKINRINHSRARNVLADVVFGGLFLDYSGAPEASSHVTACVGAGTLIIGLPRSVSIPVKVIIRNSPLCRVNLPDNFRKIEKNIFVNEYYNPGDEKMLIFDLDVAVGNIHFINK